MCYGYRKQTHVSGPILGRETEVQLILKEHAKIKEVAEDYMGTRVKNGSACEVCQF